MAFEITLPNIPGFLQYKVSADCAHIEWLEVDPNYRDCGYATRLINLLLKEHPRASVTPVPLDNTFTPKELRAFYRRRGFIHTHTYHPGDLFTYSP